MQRSCLESWRPSTEETHGGFNLGSYVLQRLTVQVWLLPFVDGLLTRIVERAQYGGQVGGQGTPFVELFGYLGLLPVLGSITTPCCSAIATITASSDANSQVTASVYCPANTAGCARSKCS
jgi:hypothetical protein